MIDPAAEVQMQGNNEASQGCPEDAASQSNSKENGPFIKCIVEPKDRKDATIYDFMNKNSSVIWEPYAMVNQGYNGPFYRQETYPPPFVSPDFLMMQQVHLNAFENNIYPINLNYSYPIENRFSYMPTVNMFSQPYPYKGYIQEFQYFVVIDFEATCDKERNLHPQEIIEFPSVLVNSATGQLEAFFQTYVRPAYHQHLTDFCKELTGIQQIQVDRGVPLSEALIMHDKWLEKKGIKHKSFAVVTWSDWDCRVMLESECKFKKIRKPPYFDRWVNLKLPFREMFGVHCNLKKAVELAGLTWEGRPHCGLDDACNTARLLVHLMDRGFKFSITNSLNLFSDQNQQAQKPREPAAALIPSRPFVDTSRKEKHTCYCGVLSRECFVRKPGPTQGKSFFACGNWTATRRNICNYFHWASS
ncbi:3'-5' exonuclease eri-1-like [Zingiber officinale]|uniref:3'-5' exonuclease eri-1-like n=1 Tax=Zingiber officinale TaxID=94328 RepID=UPI001C4D0413|nr:3'-5' exonuclease eri-1-like [Zingiber officinale]XP_042385689.1 3'-5' exonuclease eri-1-like [Zingiber officinale]